MQSTKRKNKQYLHEYIKKGCIFISIKIKQKHKENFKRKPNKAFSLSLIVQKTVWDVPLHCVLQKPKMGYTTARNLQKREEKSEKANKSPSSASPTSSITIPFIFPLISPTKPNNTVKKKEIVTKTEEHHQNMLIALSSPPLP